MIEIEDEVSAPLIQNRQDASASEPEENSPVEQVALTVPPIDHPTLPVVTFRVWVLGAAACVLLSFLNQFFWYRREPLSISSISAQIAVVPLGHLMAAALTRRVFFEGQNWEFSLNPGGFNVKEHVLITIFANSGAANPYSIHIVTAVKVFYKQRLSFWVALGVVLTTQILGFGWAGLLRRYLVEPASMWWPQNLVQVSLFRALHEKEVRARGALTRNQFFLIAFICSFAYYVFPGYLFPKLTSISWLCWIFSSSVLIQQLGSGLHGLGIGAIGLDWSSISSYLGSPLASPWFATANIAVGYFFCMYVVTPFMYWLDIFKAKTFPIFSDDLFTSDGQNYNISAIIDSNFHIDLQAYEHEGRLYLSTFFAVGYGFSFACLTATIIHVLLFHGKELWLLSKSAFKDKKIDIHTKLMQNYNHVPEWWFLCVLFINIMGTLLLCHYYNDELQLPWWGVVLACALAFFFTLPVGVITHSSSYCYAGIKRRRQCCSSQRTATMEPDQSHSIPKASSLRWQILRRALLRRPSNSGFAGNPNEKFTLDKVSRRPRSGFNLIPCHVVNKGEEDSDSLTKGDVCFCYTLPLPNAPKLFLRQRWEDCVDLNDFEVCNQYDIDNTGLVCQWPSEDVLAYYSITHIDSFRNKRVIELGSGYGLAGLVIATVTEALEVVISDGNPQVVDYIQRNIDTNSAAFGSTKVKSMILHWDQHEVSDISGTFDVIVASDCTFFKNFHKGLARTIRCLLKEHGPSEAMLFSPKRGDSLDKFMVEVKDSRLRFTLTETYDTKIWSRHNDIINGDHSWPNYESDHCYPLLISITR